MTSVGGYVQDIADGKVAALPQMCGLCERSDAVPYDQWLDGDEAQISRLDERSYCVVVDVASRGNGTSIKLSLQVFNGGSHGLSVAPLSKLIWADGTAGPSTWSLSRDGSCSCDCILRGSMCFDGVPGRVLEGEFAFRFGDDGYTLATLSLPRGVSTSGDCSACMGSKGPAELAKAPAAAAEGAQQPRAYSDMAEVGVSEADEGLSLPAHVAAPAPVAPLPAPSCRSKNHQVLKVVVSTMAGEVMHTLNVSPSDTVYEVKQRLARFASIDIGHLQLVDGCTRLKDSDTLESCRRLTSTRGSLADVLEDTAVGSGNENSDAPVVPESSPLEVEPALHLTCIQVGRSSIASRFEEMRKSTDPRLAQYASLADVVDPVMQLENTMSEQRRPRAEAILASIPANVRSKFIAWMAEAFEVLQFDSFILFGALLTMDRYCACVNSTRDHSEMGLEMLAAICTEMKLAREDQFPTELTRRLLHHICQGRFALKDIFRVEYSILTKLGFAMWVPTPLHFFGGLTLRLGSGEGREGQPAAVEALECYYLGLLLLHVSLLDAGLLYAYPHAVLAAAALSGAMGVLEKPDEQRQELLRDLAAYRPATAGAADESVVLQCEERLLNLWWQCTTGESPHAEFFGTIEARFASPTYHRVSRQCPRERLAQLRSTLRYCSADVF